MKKIIGLNTELKKVGGESFTKIEGKPEEGLCPECQQRQVLMMKTRPLTIGDVVLDYINSYGFPPKPTTKDLKEMSKMMELGEKIYQSADELTLEDAEFEMLKKVLNPPEHSKVAAVVVQVMRILDDVEDIKVQPVQKDTVKD